MLSRTLSSRKFRTLKKADRPTSLRVFAIQVGRNFNSLYWEKTGKKQNDVCEILRANSEWKLLVKQGKILCFSKYYSKCFFKSRFSKTNQSVYIK